MTAEVTMMRTPAETRLAEQFKAARGTFPAVSAGARDEAFARFAAKGLPHRRIEAWHYTDLRSLLREAYPPAAAPSAEAVGRAKAWLDAHAAADHRRIVLLDGTFMADLSDLADLPRGVTIAAAGVDGLREPGLLAAERLAASESILALNGAFARSGVDIALAAGATLDRPIEMISAVSGDAQVAVTSRSSVSLGDHAVATLVERHVSLGPVDHQGNHAFTAAIGNGAALDHVAIIESLPATALHVGSWMVRLGADARFTSFTLTATPGVTRRQGFVDFCGEQSTSTFNGVSLLDGRSHADTTLLVTHTAPHCVSREYYKTILDGESTGVYQGKVVVAPGAQKTDGKMLSKAIFLADGASMYNKPELEIFADDVVCGHGATVGNLDETQLFYLRARGIPLKEAESLLLNAFAADAIEIVADEPLRDDLTRSVEQWLRKRQS